MKSLKESLLDSKTQMTESLFDKDLVEKDYNVPVFILKEILNYKEFDDDALKSVINRLDDVFELNKRIEATHLSIKIKPNTLYVAYDFITRPFYIILIAKGLGGNPSENYILRIAGESWSRFNKEINSRMIDQSDEDYLIWMEYFKSHKMKFSEYPLSKQDIKDFLNIYNKT